MILCQAQKSQHKIDSFYLALLYPSYRNIVDHHHYLFKQKLVFLSETLNRLTPLWSCIADPDFFCYIVNYLLIFWLHLQKWTLFWFTFLHLFVPCSWVQYFITKSCIIAVVCNVKLVKQNQQIYFNCYLVNTTLSTSHNKTLK